MDKWTILLILAAFTVLLYVVLRKVRSHLAFVEYVEFCYHMNQWLNDAEMGMGWAETIFHHQFGLCDNFHRWLCDKEYPSEVRIHHEDWVIKHIYKSKAFPFGDRDTYHQHANKYTNPIRRDHVRQYASYHRL